METLAKAGSPAPISLSNQVDTVLDAVRIATGHALTGRVARLVAALPFIAGCTDAFRCAGANLALYALSLTGLVHKLNDHRPEYDHDIFDRIKPILRFDEGDAKAIAHGSALLGLVLLYGYQRDLAKDSASGEYNPLLSGAWDFEQKRAELEEMVEHNFSPAVEKELPLRAVPTMEWR